MYTGLFQGLHTHSPNSEPGHTQILNMQTPHIVSQHSRADPKMPCLPCSPGCRWLVSRAAEPPSLRGPPGRPGEGASHLAPTRRLLSPHTAADCGPPPPGSAWQRCAKGCSHSETEEATQSLVTGMQSWQCQHTSRGWVWFLAGWTPNEQDWHHPGAI